MNINSLKTTLAVSTLALTFLMGCTDGNKEPLSLKKLSKFDSTFTKNMDGTSNAMIEAQNATKIYLAKSDSAHQEAIKEQMSDFRKVNAEANQEIAGANKAAKELLELAKMK